MGVCDGHGAVGHLVSNFVKVNLPKILSNLILNKGEAANQAGRGKKQKSFLPQIGGSKNHDAEESDVENPEDGPNVTANEKWLSNANHKVRDVQIKDAFIKTEKKMEHKSRIDAMLSGTTCVMTFFNHDMIVCANSGDSRAILVSEQEHNGMGTG